MKPSPSPIARTDAQIKADVLSELAYEPSVKVTDIGVLVKDGIVTLNGSATSHGDKSQALRAARRVAGVKAIADDIRIDLPELHRRTDGEIAAAAVRQFAWSTTVPKGAAAVTVRDGWITLEGEVEWWYQKAAAEDALQYMVGLKGVTNLITIRPLISATDVAQSIRTAFERNAMLDARKIEVETFGSIVQLVGAVANNTEREEAERVAWAAPGVQSVDNKLRIAWNWKMFK